MFREISSVLVFISKVTWPLGQGCGLKFGGGGLYCLRSIGKEGSHAKERNRVH